MSECRTELIKCPHCNHVTPMTIWNSINSTLDPDLKEKLLNGKLFDWKCEVCGFVANVSFSTLYHDMKHRFMILFDPLEDNRYSDEIAPIEIPDNLNLPGYFFRLVYGMNALKEKIDILEAGLNDVAVERMKFFIRYDADNQIRESDEFICIGKDVSEKAIEATGWDRGAILFIRFREKSAPKLKPFPLELYYDYLLAIDFDPRMKTSGWACVDSKWMNEQLIKL